MTIDVRKLPKKTLRAGIRLYRIHRADRNPWYFDDSELGRFNPVGAPGRGACYWAERPLGAWVEVFRTRMLLPESEIDGRTLSVITLDTDAVAFDLTTRRALAAGVTAAMMSSPDYSESQGLARVIGGSDALLRWRVRHDLEQRLVGIAWFGPAGTASRARLRTLPHATPGPITKRLIDQARASFGYTVLPDPPR